MRKTIILLAAAVFDTVPCEAPPLRHTRWIEPEQPNGNAVENLSTRNKT